ncbi:MAG: methylenetetrahydrofolate reductase [Desulfobacterales bacterium]|jgi:5,10-methylenetetrahydrofolate reductase|nr:methylenetetrahydrofolate reductase [Desulfobacterales bacterium]
MGLGNKLNAKEFVILAEMEPPKGTNAARMVESVLRVKGAVDAFVVPEMSNAVMRMSALGAAMILQHKGVETIMQVCCRDRNRLALQADLLAASAAGITHLMAVQGEAPSYGDHHQARAVYDIELLELLHVVAKLQSGKDMAGIELDGAPIFTVGAMVNAGLKGQPLERELADMKLKIDAGANFFIIPPVFEVEAVQPFMSQVSGLNVRVIPTVLLLKSMGMARYVQRHLPHVHIPDSVIQRITKAPDKARECIHIAAETVLTLKSAGFSGVMLSTIGWEHRLPEIIAAMA